MVNIVSNYSAVSDGAYETLTLTISNGGTSLVRSSGLWPANINNKGISIAGVDQTTTPFLSTTVISGQGTNTIILAATAPSALSAASRLVIYGTDNATPFANFTADNQGATVSLTIPAGVYYVSNANPIFSGITNLTVDATGATLVGGTINFAVFSQHPDNTHHARTVTAYEGSSSVTLLTPAEASRFSVNQWVLMTSVDQQGFGYPTNQYYFEYVQISSIVGGVITFSTPLKYTHLSTWPLFNVGDVNNPNYGGPATLYSLYPDWNCSQTFNNLTFVQAYQSGSSGRIVVWNNCTFLLGPPVFPSVVQNWTFTGCTSATGIMEFDKLVSKATITNSTIKDLFIQSPNEVLIINGGSTITNLIGCCKNTTIEDCTITTSAQVGPSVYGGGLSIAVRNSNIGTVTISQSLIDSSSLTYNNYGTFSKVSGLPLPPFIPGRKYCFIYYSGSINKIPDSGGEVSFRVMNIRDDGTNIYIDTDLRSPLPTPTFNGGANTTNKYLAYPFESVIQIGGSGTDLTTLMAPTTIRTSAWEMNS